ncbi:MAG: hypothetical protein OXF01_13545 [Gemmatimonadetes bacterium]|nr:hypothetical protein [Gemmatimonadota bacterium]
MVVWVGDMAGWVTGRKGRSGGTGSGRPGGWLALAAALAVVAAAPVPENAGRVVGSPTEVAGLPVACGPGAAPASVLSLPAGAARTPVAPARATGPDYYRFPMVSTRRVPGTGNATGVGELVFARSPFGISLTEDGSYLYDFTVRFERLRPARAGTYVVWTTTPELDRIVPAGELTDPAAFSGKVAWNKFLVVVTLEPAFDPDATTWTGPIVIRGMSRSGMMHTMAGHGPFEQENCAAYGYE